jgi:hypothetical protein
MKVNKKIKNATDKIEGKSVVKLILFGLWLLSFFFVGWKLNAICLFLITQIYLGEIRQNNYGTDSELSELIDETFKP